MEYQTLSVPSSIVGRLHQEDFANRVWLSLIRRHAHRFTEVHLISRGRAVLLLDSRRMELTSGSLLWIPSGTEHLTLEAAPSLRRWILCVRSVTVRRIVGRGAALPTSTRRGAVCTRLTRTELRDLDRLMDDVARRMGIDPGLTNAGLGYVLARVALAFRLMEPTEAPSALHPTVARALARMQDQGFDLDRAALAAHCGTSETQLSRLFVRELGQPLSEIRNRMRLARFEHLMASARCETLTEAALEAGFGSYSQFHRVCRRLTGRPPSTWNRQPGD